MVRHLTGDTDTRLTLMVAHRRVESLAKPTRPRIEVPTMRHFSLLAAMTLVFAFAAPALAAQPQRGCPSAFDGPVSIDDLIEQYDQFIAADFRAFLAPIDANDDGMLCTLPFPTNAHLYGEPFFVANFIDNVANR